MSEVIRIPTSTYERLKNIAEPFVDETPADVINKLLDYHEQHNVSEPASSFNSGREIQLFSPDDAPNLAHTRALDIRVNGKTIKPKWNYLVIEMHKMAVEKLGNFEDVRKISQSNIVNEKKVDSGFKFVQELGFSIQYCDSNHAWSNSVFLAKQLSASIEVEFEWMNKDKAAHPGQKGRLIWPTNSKTQRRGLQS